MFQSLIFLCASHITQSHQLKNGGVKFLKTTPAVKEKEELDCIDIVENNFVYQMNNACHKRNTLESAQKSDEPDNQTLQSGVKVRKMQNHVEGH